MYMKKNQTQKQNKCIKNSTFQQMNKSQISSFETFERVILLIGRTICHCVVHIVGCVFI